MDGNVGMGMGLEGMDDDEMPIMAGASRPWLSTTGILALLSVFLITLVGIILFSLYLYFLQAKLECPDCKVADVATLKKKKLTTTTTSTESILRQIVAPEEEVPARLLWMRLRRQRLRMRKRRRRRLLRIWRRLRPYYQARLYAWLWRSLSAEMRQKRQLRARTSLVASRSRLVGGRQRLPLRGSRRRLHWKGMWRNRRRRRRASRRSRFVTFVWGRRFRARNVMRY
ncbi:uncharacterized protein [Dermacentor albipictus]|uniref:uncharacterized protein n=1 Tax=Dermacentor albipictus TaxID=60249 RepID=UPI0031FDD782